MLIANLVENKNDEKQKKLLATLLLPLAMSQTVCSFFIPLGAEKIVSEILKIEKTPDYRRVSNTKSEPEQLIKITTTL